MTQSPFGFMSLLPAQNGLPQTALVPFASAFHVTLSIQELSLTEKGYMWN